MTPEQQNQLAADRLAIAEAIGEEWCWQACVNCRGRGEINVADPGPYVQMKPCPDCNGTGKLPTIGDIDPITQTSNILAVVQWAAKQKWWRGVSYYLVEKIWACLTTSRCGNERATNEIISAIARCCDIDAGIRGSK